MKRFFPILFIAAFMVGVFSPITVSLTTPDAPAISVQIQTASAAVDDIVHKDDNTDDKYDFYGNEIKCNFVNHFSGCITLIFYFIPYYVGGKLMLFSAWIFDSLAATTLSSKIYSGSEFIQSGWSVTRDFANIFLILILLFTALSFVLGIEPGHSNPKKMLVSVVLIAIVINFSMFITEVVIDTSNSLALVFYNQITVTVIKPAGTTSNPGPVSTPGQVEPKPISTALAEAFQPQVLQSEAFWTALKTGKPYAAPPANEANKTKEEIQADKDNLHLAVTAGIMATNVFAGSFYYIFGSEDTTVSAPQMILILVLVGCMYFVVAYSFLIASLSFLGRLAGLWVAIIFAPFAFVSYIIPSLHGIKGFGWSEWWKSLFEMAFAAPIYFFFLLLISLMSKSAIISRTFDKQGAWAILIIVVMSMLLLIVLLLKATSYVRKASGELGEMAIKAGSALVAGVGGLALGAVTGGASFAARNTAGFLGKSIAENDNRKQLASGLVTDKWRKSNSWAKDMSDDQVKASTKFKFDQKKAKATVSIGRKMAKSSFDLRQTGVANFISEKSGMNFKSVGVLGTKASAGGYDGATNRIAQKNKDFADSLGYNHNEQAALADAVENREVETDETRQKIAEYTSIMKDKSVDPDKTLPNSNVRIADEIQRLTAELGRMGGNTPVGKFTEQEVRENIKNKAVHPPESPHAGQAFKLSDVGLVKDTKHLAPATDKNGNAITDSKGKPISHVYNQQDVTDGTLRADGKKVQQSDVGRTTRTEFVGLGGLKKAQETQMKALSNAFQHQMMVNSGYNVEGVKYDALGNIKQLGHYHGVGNTNLDTARSLGRSIRRTLASTAMGAAIGTGFAPGVGTIVGAIGGLAGQIRKNIQDHNDHTGPRGQAAAAAGLAADTHAHIVVVKSEYKSPSSKIFDMFKSLAGGGDHGGGGHGDGGHSQGDGGGGHH